jgi:hypothetical protein
LVEQVRSRTVEQEITEIAEKEETVFPAVVLTCGLLLSCSPALLFASCE